MPSRRISARRFLQTDGRAPEDADDGGVGNELRVRTRRRLGELLRTRVHDLVADACAGEEVLVFDVGLRGAHAAVDDVADELAETVHRRDHPDLQVGRKRCPPLRAARSPDDVHPVTPQAPTNESPAMLVRALHARNARRSTVRAQDVIGGYELLVHGWAILTRRGRARRYVS